MIYNNVFPNIKENVAEMRPHSQTIHLHYISRKSISDALHRKDFIFLANTCPTIAHEMTHWVDLISTVWGQEYLISLFDAMESISDNYELGEAENQWWKLINLYDDDRRIMFPKYYKIVKNPSQIYNITNPWTISSSVGFEFSADGRQNKDRPIFFVRFGGSVTLDSLIARVPLTVGSLLECNAVYYEMKDEIRFLAGIDDEGERVVETNIKVRERLDTLYDENLVDYTVAVHLLSVKANTKEIYITYRLASRLSNICLNMTKAHFSNIQISEDIDYGKKIIEAFRSSSNRGFAYACLVSCAPQYSKEMSEEDWISQTLRNANLPCEKQIMEDAYNYVFSLNIPESERFYLDKTKNYLLSVGREISKIKWIIKPDLSPEKINQNGIPLPPMFFSDGELYTYYKKTTDPSLFNPNTMHDVEWDLRRAIDAFLVASRGI